MARGIKLFRVLGINISIDYTWFIILVVFTWSLAFGYFPFKLPGFGRLTYFFMGFISAILLFACVLVHEISHSYTSNRLGLEIKDITLFIFGGVAQLTKEPDDPKVELKIAIAGPAASLVLGVLFWAASRLVDKTAYPVANSILSYLALINIVLLVFNMIPGFPLDGGRVFRAIWWDRTGDLNRATKVASNIGKGFAIFLIIFGFFQILTGNFVGGLWSVLIGVFVQQAAESGYQQLLVKRALEGVRVADVMSKNVISVREEMPLTEAVENYFFKYHFVSFPVTSNGRVTGLLALHNVRDVNRDRWDETHVKEVMFKLEAGDFLNPEDDAMVALNKMSAGDHFGRFPVLNDKGELVGMLSRRDIMKLLEFKAGLHG